MILITPLPPIHKPTSTATFKDDHGVVYNRTITVKGQKKSLGPLQIDWRVPAARQWWVSTVTQAHDGGQLFDGLLVDSACASMHLDNTSHFMSWYNAKDLLQAKMDMLHEAEQLFDQLKGGKGKGEIIGNPLLDWGVVGDGRHQVRAGGGTTCCDTVSLLFFWFRVVVVVVVV